MVYASSINEMETYEYLQSDDIEPAGGYIYGTGKLAAHLMGETVAKINGIELGYYVSVAKGLDVDKPRNLAKSVTVE